MIVIKIERFEQVPWACGTKQTRQGAATSSKTFIKTYKNEAKCQGCILYRYSTMLSGRWEVLHKILFPAGFEPATLRV